MNCKICNHQVKEKYNFTTNLLNRKENIKVLECPNCNVSFLEGEFNEESSDNYIDKIKNLETTDGLSYDFRIEAIGKYRKLNKLLDFGCGFGGFMNEAKKHGWEVYGQDVSPEAIEYVKNKLNIKNCFSVNEILNEKFDAVTLWGVIEHLDYPAEDLDKILKNLRKGGVIIIFCPNTYNFFYTLSKIIYRLSFGKINWFLKRVYIPQHRFYFNEKSIKYLLDKHRLNIRSFKKINVNLDSIFKTYKNELWAKFLFTKLLIRTLDKFTKSHFEIVCEKE